MNETDRDSTIRRGHTAAGLSATGTLVTGAAGLVGALAAVLAGDFIGGGFFLGAAALAFGLLANAVYRQ